MSHVCIISFAKIPPMRTLRPFDMSTSHLEVVLENAHSDTTVLTFKYKFLQHVYILLQLFVKAIFNYKLMWQYIIDEMIN